MLWRGQDTHNDLGRSCADTLSSDSVPIEILATATSFMGWRSWREGAKQWKEQQDLAALFINMCQSLWLRQRRDKDIYIMFTLKCFVSLLCMPHFTSF